MSSLRVDTDTEFHRFVERMLTATPVPGAAWSDDHTTIRFPKRSAAGYDIEVGCSPSAGIIWLGRLKRKGIQWPPQNRFPTPRTSTSSSRR